MVEKQSAVRFAAFAGVMVVMSGLVLTLFDEARAVDMEFQSPVSTVRGTQEYTINMELPGNTYVPVDEITAFIERGGSNAADPKQGATLVTRATCDFSLVVSAAGTSRVCGPDADATTTDNPLATSGSNPNGVHSIRFNGFYTEEANLGETDFDREPGQFFGYHTFTGVSTTGYGYDPTYGYGYSAAVVTPGDPGSGYGYGYGAGALYLQFIVTVQGSGLASGQHYLTLGVDTGSNTIGVLYSPAQGFTVNHVGGVGNNNGNTGNTGPVVVKPTANPDPPAGSTTSFTGTFSDAQQGDTVQVQTGDARIGTVEVQLGQDAADATITVSRFPADSPPEGTAPAPDGVTVTDFIQVTISIGGSSHTMTVAVSVPEDEAGDPDKAVLLKFDPESARWEPQNRLQLTLVDGNFVANGEAPCCSDFAVGFDEQDPTVALSLSGSILGGVQTLTATASDNLQLDRVEFYLGDQLLGTKSASPYTWEFDTADHDNGDVLLKAVAYDFVGNSAEHSQPATLSNAEDPGATTGPDETGTPGPGPSDDGFPWGMLLIGLIVVAVIAGAAYTMRKQK